MLNHTSQISPFGSSIFTTNGTTTVGGNAVPSYTQTVSLSPQQQQLFDSQQGVQQGLTNIAQQKMAQIPTGPLDLSGLPQVPGTADLTKYAGDTSKQLYDSQVALMQPQFERQQELLDSQLANQGLARGSEGFTNAQKDFQTNEDLALGQVASGATTTGANLANQIFGQGIQGQNQALNILETQRNTPINELAAILKGSPAVGMPTFQGLTPTQVAPTDVIGAYGLQNAANQSAYQGQVANTSSQNAGAAGLGSAVIMGGALAIF